VSDFSHNWLSVVLIANLMCQWQNNFGTPSYYSVKHCQKTNGAIGERSSGISSTREGRKVRKKWGKSIQSPTQIAEENNPSRVRRRESRSFNF
jgi:hypothetical protein